MNKAQVDNCDDILLSMRQIAENLKEVTDKLDLETAKTMPLEMNKTQVDNCDDILLSMRQIAENLKEVTDKLDLETGKAMPRKMNKAQVDNCDDVLLSMRLIAENLKEATDKLDLEVIKAMLRKILEGERIFVMGAGRSGLVAKAFAMRLMHLGFSVYVVGETTTPAVRPQDVVIAISGSGETRSIADLGKIVKDIGATLITVTSKKESTLGRTSDIAVLLPSKSKNDLDAGGYLERNLRGEYRKMPPLGTSFEITSLIFLDSIIAQLIIIIGASEADLKSRHTNIE